MEFISWRPQDVNTSIARDYYNRKSLIAYSSGNKGEWKSVFINKDFHELLAELDTPILHNDDKQYTCESCITPTSSAKSHDSIDNVDGGLTYILPILLIVYFRKCYRVARDRKKLE